MKGKLNCVREGREGESEGEEKGVERERWVRTIGERLGEKEGGEEEGEEGSLVEEWGLFPLNKLRNKDSLDIVREEETSSQRGRGRGSEGEVVNLSNTIGINKESNSNTTVLLPMRSGEARRWSERERERGKWVEFNVLTIRIGRASEWEVIRGSGRGGQ